MIVLLESIDRTLVVVSEGWSITLNASPYICVYKNARYIIMHSYLYNVYYILFTLLPVFLYHIFKILRGQDEGFVPLKYTYGTKTNQNLAITYILNSKTS